MFRNVFAFVVTSRHEQHLIKTLGTIIGDAPIRCEIALIATIKNVNIGISPYFEVLLMIKVFAKTMITMRNRQAEKATTAATPFARTKTTSARGASFGPITAFKGEVGR